MGTRFASTLGGPVFRLQQSAACTRPNGLRDTRHVRSPMIAVYVIKQYERAVVFKLGKVEGPARGPGLIFIVPFVQRIHRVSLRIVTMPIQSQGIITEDNVSIDVSAVAYYRVEDPVRSVVAIENVEAAIGRSPRP